MSTENGQPRLTVADLVTRCRGQFIPLNHTFSYFCTPSMAEEDLRQYLHDPIAALSPVICTDLGKVGTGAGAVPGKRQWPQPATLVSFEKPPDGRQLAVSRVEAGDDDHPGAGDQGRRRRQLSLHVLQCAGRADGG